MAALANGAMIHCLDYDDQTPWGQHSGSSLLPAVFAAAERRGGVSGKQMITAVAVGQDIFNRMRQHVEWKKDWNFSTVMGVISATAATVRDVLGLSRDQIAHSFGIASMQCCGTMNVIHSVGGDLRAMYAAFPAKGAVLAAILAQKGVTGRSRNIRRRARHIRPVLWQQVRPRAARERAGHGSSPEGARCTSGGRPSVRRTATFTRRSRS